MNEKEKRDWELWLKMRAGKLTRAEEKELFPENFQAIPKLSPEERVRKFEQACKWFGVKASEIIGPILQKEEPRG